MRLTKIILTSSLAYLLVVAAFVTACAALFSMCSLSPVRPAAASARTLVCLGDSNTSRGWDEQDRWCEYVAPMLLP